MISTKIVLGNLKEKAIKEGKNYKEPGVYFIRGRKGPILKSIYRCKQCLNKYKATKPIFQFKYKNRFLLHDQFKSFLL